MPGLREALIDALVEAIRVAETRLPLDVYQALRDWLGRAEGPARAQLEAILENVDIAAREGRPICQDTGLITVYVRLPPRYPLTMREIGEAIVEAVRRATREVPLRPNAVDPIRDKNSGDNTGRHVPIVHWEPGDS